MDESRLQSDRVPTQDGKIMLRPHWNGATNTHADGHSGGRDVTFKKPQTISMPVVNVNKDIKDKDAIEE